MRKTLSVIIAIIFLVTVASAQYSTLKVGGNEGEFGKIQEAIEAAKAGDRIEISNGTYMENLIVNKPMKLIAIGNAIIDAGGDYFKGPAITITADNAAIEGFTITNSTNTAGDPYAGAGIEIRSNNSIIRNNSIIKNLRSGVKILRGHNNSIIYNNINNNYEGILVSRSSNNLIYGNNIADNSGNGVIFIEGSTNNSISNNTISKNLVGIMLKNSGFNHIKHNNLIDNIQENLKIIK
ncbi:MAG: right-handed parallel beta-helix repeat-containing protein [Methanotrichaceae archaeon]|nr:right-handed parallel beta-helix repeat-containing protein [Methanotrichaceae archaeon]